MNADGWPASPQLDLTPDQVISGKAFSMPFRILALLLVEGAAWWGYVLWSHGKLGTSVTTSALWLLAALVLMCVTVFFVFRSVTSISVSHLKLAAGFDRRPN